MIYKLTVERAYRIGLEFEANSIEEAENMAASLANDVSDEIFDGDIENDYSLCSEDGVTIIDWG